MENYESEKENYVTYCGGMLGETLYHGFGKEYGLKCTDIDVYEMWLCLPRFPQL